jgi:hypothetical protein
MVARMMMETWFDLATICAAVALLMWYLKI